jgi:hypothetical protein
MKFKYIVIVDDGQCTGAKFTFYNQYELINFIQTCFSTSIERYIQINKEVLQEEENGDISEN